MEGSLSKYTKKEEWEGRLEEIEKRKRKGAYIIMSLESRELEIRMFCVVKEREMETETASFVYSNFVWCWEVRFSSLV